MGVRPRVDEPDAQDVDLGGADHRPRRRAVVDPRREEHAGRDLELDVRRRQVVLANASWAVRQRRRRIEERVEVVRPSDGRCFVAHHRGVTDGAVDVVLRRALVSRVVVRARRRIGLERELADERGGSKRRRSREQLSSGESCFRHG